jgi:hypothetical protein
VKLSAPPPPPPPPGDDNLGANAPGSPDDPNSNLAANAPGSPEAAPAPADGAPTSPGVAPSPEAAPAPEGRPLSWPAWYAGVDSAIAGLVLVLALAAASFVARNSDVWVHLAAGQRLFHGEYFPGGKDPFSYSAADRTWVNHSWLTDAVAYLLYGGEGKVLSAAKAVVVALTFGLLMAIRRPPHALWPWAVVTCVAVLAAAPQLFLRPAVVSMLFLAATLYILFRMPRGENPWRLPVAIGVTFWLWANCDSWFILGPLALGLLILGELIQQNMMNRADEPDAESDGEPLGRLPDLATLGKALGVGVVACMLTPHHVRVWELPFELLGAEGAKDDPRTRALFMSVFDETYYRSAGWGSNLNGAAFAILVLVGAAALGFGFGRLRVSHVVLWVGFLALALFRISAIPFFAIVAVPMIAAQLNSLSSRVELKAWGDPRSRLLWIGSSLGRVLCVLGVSALCVLAYPGWIHPDVTNAASARRIAWGVEPDPLLKQAAEQLNQWRAEEKLPPDARGFIASTDLANYAAWFAPREKVYINSRYNHHRPELGNYLKLRRGLGLVVVKDDSTNLSDALAVMKDAGADYLAISVGAGENATVRNWAGQATLLLYSAWREWAPLYLDGQTTVFAWLPGGKGRPELAALRLDPVAVAFAPDTEPLKQPELKPPLLELGWEEPFVRPARPAPPGVAEAVGWLRYKDGLQSRLERLGRFQARAQEVRRFRAVMTWSALDSALPHQLAMVAATASRALPLPQEPTANPEVDSARAVAFLALRAARRAILQDPDHPDSYYVLALALSDPNLPMTESERALGVVTAYRQCLMRMPRPERHKRGQFLASPVDVALRLTTLYLGQAITGRRDPKASRPAVVGFVGMPVDVAPLNMYLGQVLFEDPRGKIVRLPFAAVGPHQSPPNLRRLSGETPYYLAADAALDAAQLAHRYALAETAGEPPEAAKELLRPIEGVLKEVENQVVRSTEDYEKMKPRPPKLPELVAAAQASSLPNEAVKLFSKRDNGDPRDNDELNKEFGPRLNPAVIQQLALRLFLGRAEDVAADLADADFVARIEKAGFKQDIQRLRYQKAVLLGEYKAAGEAQEILYNQGGIDLAKLPPPGPEVDRRIVLDAIALRYQIRDPQGQQQEKVLASLLRPPALVPLHPLMRPILLLAEAPHRANPEELAKPRSSPIVLEGWTSDWAVLTGVLQQVISAQMQGEAEYNYLRGWLSLMEGDVPTAERWFRQTPRTAPKGWGVPNVAHGEANFYLRLIEHARAKAAAK